MAGEDLEYEPGENMSRPVTLARRRHELNVNKLVHEAQQQANLSDFGDDSFFTALNKVLECYASDLDFHQQGLADFQKEIVRNLVNRLRFQNDLKQHPEIHDEDVSDPIIILGLPRSGTTKFHRMTATDPGLLKTYTWQLINPAPFPDSSPGLPDPRIMAAADEMFLKDNTDLHAAQYFAAHEIHEETWLYAMTFNSELYLSGRMPSPSIARWLETRTTPSDLHSYRFVRSLFQYLQWQQGGRQNRRWLMKYTGHLPYIEELLAVYPKATLVHVHRHPQYNIGSLAKMLEHVWKMRVANIDSSFAGQHTLERTRFRLDRYMELRSRPEINERIFDVTYDQVRDQPLPVIEEVYHRAGCELTDEARHAMLAWEADNPQGKRGRHTYSLEELGLDPVHIEAVFKDYIERFVSNDGLTSMAPA